MTRKPDPPLPQRDPDLITYVDEPDRVSTTLLGLFVLLWAVVSAVLVGVLAWVAWQALGWWILAVPPALAVLAKVCHRIGSRLEGS